jgi:hypothetical protein
VEQRSFDRLGRHAGVVGLGAWQLGADWGEVSESAALDVLAAVEGTYDEPIRPKVRGRW